MSKAIRILFFATIVASVSSLSAQQNELRSLADELAQDISATGKKTIAVVDFTDLRGNRVGTW